MPKHPRLVLARVNYSQLYGVYDHGKIPRQRDVLIPYHLLNLAGYARASGMDVALIDGEVDVLGQEQLADAILEKDPQYVGLTATTPDVLLAVEVCTLLKKHTPGIITVIGGTHASVMPDDVAQHAVVDYVVVGDGEQAIVEIVNSFPSGAGRINARRLNGKIVKTDDIDLSMSPLPAHDLLDYGKYLFSDPTRGQIRTASVMSSRGCPFECSFCAHSRKVRFRPIAEFIREIAGLYDQQGVRYFYVYDDTFLLRDDRLLEFARELKGLDLVDARFQCLARANQVTRDRIELLRDVGFVRVSIGVESGSDELLKRVSKGVTKEECLRACRVISEAGLETRASFIIGHPWETQATAEETIAFAQELEIMHANFTVMTPYPGTRVYAQACRGEGIRFSQPELATDWNAFRRWGQPIIRTDELTSEDLERLRETAITEFYTQPKVTDYYRRLFESGNRSRFIHRPVNFAWRRKYGDDLPYWDQLGDEKFLEPY